MRAWRNVTIEPLAPAPAVETPQIAQILSLRSGRLLDARRFITRHRYEELVRVRTRVLEAMYAGKPRLVCSVCHTPFYIVASTRKAFFFRPRHGWLLPGRHAQLRDSGGDPRPPICRRAGERG